MAVQIRGRQILNSTITSGKIDLTGSFNFSSGTLQCGTPSADADVANKAYVQSYVAGLAWKASCVVATTGNITIATALNVGDSIDGVTLSDGDRVLVKDQSSAVENGIYVAGASPARAADMDAGSEFSSAAVFVQQGSVNADVGFVCTNNGTVNVGSDAINFTQFTGAAQIVAGDGLAKSGNTLSVNVDDSSIETNSDALRIKASGVTNAMLAGSIANAKLANSTISGVALGSNLNSLALASNSGLAMTTYNGSAAVSDLALDFDSLSSADWTLATDKLAFVNDSGQMKKKGVSNLISEISGKGLNSSAGVMRLDLDQLDAGVAQAIDEIAVDRGGTTVRESLADVFTLFAGTASNTSLDINSNALRVKVDDSSIGRDGSGNLAVKADGIGSAEIATNAVGSSEIAANAVTSSELADDSVTIAKLAYQGYFERISVADGSTSTADLARAIDTTLAQSFTVCVNGLALEYKASPDNSDNYKIDNSGSGSVGRITFGGNLTNGDVITIRYIA
jgi:hypothetical protein